MNICTCRLANTYHLSLFGPTMWPYFCEVYCSATCFLDNIQAADEYSGSNVMVCTHRLGFCIAGLLDRENQQLPPMYWRWFLVISLHVMSIGKWFGDTACIAVVCTKAGYALELVCLNRWNNWKLSTDRWRGRGGWCAVFSVRRSYPTGSVGSIPVWECLSLFLYQLVQGTSTVIFFANFIKQNIIYFAVKLSKNS